MSSKKLEGVAVGAELSELNERVSSDELNNSPQGSETAGYVLETYNKFRAVRPATEDSVFVGRALRDKFKELMKLTPWGITIEKFVSKFKEKNKYYPNFRNFGCNSFKDLAENCPDVFWIGNSPLGETLLFPSSIQTEASSHSDYVKNLFMKVWGKIEQLLSENGSILILDEIPNLLKDVSDTQVDPSDWCYLQDDGYYKYCIKETFQSETIFLYPLVPPTDQSTPRKLVQVNALVPETIRMNEQIKYEKKKAMAELRMRKGIFVGEGERIPCISNYIPQNTTHKCLAGAVQNLGHFYVNLSNYFNDLEKLMAKMQRIYKQQLRTEQDIAIPCKNHLKSGFYVAVLRQTDDEWHRGKIISQLTDDIYLVFLIDYGDFEEVEIKEIRYLYKEFSTDHYAQAIRCVSQLGAQYNRTLPNGQVLEFNRGIGYTEEEKLIFLKMIFDKNLAIGFRKKTEIDGNQCWEVWTHTLRGDSHTIEMHHVERKVMIQSRHIYVLALSEERETRKNLQELAGVKPRAPFIFVTKPPC